MTAHHTHKETIGGLDHDPDEKNKPAGITVPKG